MMREIPQGTRCANCRKHKATEHWYGDSSVVGWVHMDPAFWCECCTLKASIAYVEEQMARLPELQAKLDELTCH